MQTQKKIIIRRPKQWNTTIAHELGHGYFQLKHPFEIGLKQGDLKYNLMDYDQGVAFNKYEWDLMHDPGIVTGLFESDTSGQYAVKTHYSITNEILLESGVNKEIADKIAHYASVYADYMDGSSMKVLGWNKGFTIITPNVGWGDMKMDLEKYGSYDRTINSQSTEYIDKNGGVFIHGMLAWWEGDYEETNPNIIKLYLACDKHYPTILDKVIDIHIEESKKIIINNLNQDNKFYLPPMDPLLITINNMSWKDVLASISSCKECSNRMTLFTSPENKKKNKETAIDRSSSAGLPSINQVQELGDKNSHGVEGARYVLSQYKDKKFSNLSENDMKKIGLALHTIQDCQVHQGTRWDMGIANRVKALGMKIQENHPNIGCGLANNLEKAQQKTQEYINLIEGESDVKQFKDSLEIERRKQVMQDEDSRKMKTQPKF